MISSSDMAHIWSIRRQMGDQSVAGTDPGRDARIMRNVFTSRQALA